MLRFSLWRVTVVALAVMLLLIFSARVFTCLPSRPYSETSQTLRHIAIACSVYHEVWDRHPKAETTQELLQMLTCPAPEGRGPIALFEDSDIVRTGRDEWGTPIRLAKDARSAVWALVSAGPDGAFGTQDDLIKPVWPLEEERDPQGKYDADNGTTGGPRLRGT